MAATSGWEGRLAAGLGPVTDVRPLGADLRSVTVGGRRLAVKTGAGAADEATGLTELSRVPGAPPVPEVVLAEAGLLVTAWVDTGPRTSAHEEALGRTLAALHDAPWPAWGGGSSWIGGCPVDPSVHPDASSFYHARLSGLAARCGLEGPVGRLVVRLGDRLGPGTPALVHGDCWWGNVLWGDDGRPWLIDPSAHGGLPEEDLAMLGLFGAVPDRTLRAYLDRRDPGPGWEERVDLLTLVPLLVHAVLFGGGYRDRAEAVARRHS